MPPRVTVVSANPIRRDQSNGILMRSLFLGWPPDRLSQVFFPVVLYHAPDTEVCGEYRLVRPWGGVRRVRGTDTAAESHPAVRPAARVSQSPGFLRRVVGSVRSMNSLMPWLRTGLELWGAHSHLVTVLEKQLRELRPEIVYALIGNYWLTRVTCEACERLGLPLFIHVSDDYVTSSYLTGPLASSLRSKSDEWFRRIVRYSAGRAAISPVMAEAYEQRYGKSWDWFTTLLEAGAYRPAARPPDGVLRLTYAGHVSLDRWRPLRQLADALARLRHGRGVESRLQIFTPPDQVKLYREAMDVPPITDVRGWVPPEQLPDLFHESDILVHAESSDPVIAAYTALSFSTKISQYMMAGRPVLGLGPNDLGSMEMIRRASAGITIDSVNADVISDALSAFVLDERQREACGRRGRRFAEEWFEAGAGRRRFQESITAALGTRSDRTVGNRAGVAGIGAEI